jgi:transcription elongation GreA/GreB family factor
MLNKADIYEACVNKLQHQIEELQSAIDKVQESIENEENSTAGNKFETARAMGQEEMDRLNRQMNLAQKQMGVLHQINPSLKCETAQIGALVKTNKKLLYPCIGIGKLEIDQDIVFAISANSPIGQMLMGKTKGDKVVFAGKTEIIEAIY